MRVISRICITCAGMTFGQMVAMEIVQSTALSWQCIGCTGCLLFATGCFFALLAAISEGGK